tara:strand:- start:336 stop:548 length:213 start_codon:yes stop_codon:yes gene_type:complete
MDEKIEWKDVTTHDELVKYINEHIGMNNLYDELYEDLLYGMIKNREAKKKDEKLQKELSDMGGIVMPNGN